MTVRRHQIKAIGASIEKLTRPIFAKRGFGAGGIVEHWADIMGSVLANASFPERITYPMGKRVNGTLQLRIASSGLALEIQHLEPQIIERINSHFGYAAVAKLRIIHGPIPKPKETKAAPRAELGAEKRADLNRQLDGISDPELKAALKALGEGILTRSEN
ncbi:MAG: DUF721 domain-containing protein [Rhodospirillales bacterium]|nr:DUF721 domain-containing protein [Rhodospirillales bacterium]